MFSTPSAQTVKATAKAIVKYTAYAAAIAGGVYVGKLAVQRYGRSAVSAAQTAADVASEQVVGG